MWAAFLYELVNGAMLEVRRLRDTGGNMRATVSLRWRLKTQRKTATIVLYIN